MKITLDIKDTRFAAFLELIKTLDYVSVSEEDQAIPKWQIKEAAKRLKAIKQNPEKSIDFDKTIDNIEKKYGL